MQRVDREKDTIICDLDGTIALDAGRAKKFLHPPHGASCASLENDRIGYACDCGWKRDWDGYYAACHEDEPNWPVIDTLRLFWEDGYNIRILSGRRETTREATVRWLALSSVPYHTLVLRPEGVFTDDQILKPSIAKERGWLPENTLFILEDRQRVVDAWRQEGYTVFQVAPGQF